MSEFYSDFKDSTPSGVERTYTIQYFWDDEYHTEEVTTSGTKVTAKLIVLRRAKAKKHFPYGEFKILKVSE